MKMNNKLKWTLKILGMIPVCFIPAWLSNVLYYKLPTDFKFTITYFIGAFAGMICLLYSTKVLGGDK